MHRVGGGLATLDAGISYGIQDGSGSGAYGKSVGLLWFCWITRPRIFR
jgi:hypothetical protein